MKKETKIPRTVYKTPANKIFKYWPCRNFCASAKVKDLQEGDFDFEWETSN